VRYGPDPDITYAVELGLADEEREFPRNVGGVCPAFALDEARLKRAKTQLRMAVRRAGLDDFEPADVMTTVVFYRGNDGHTYEIGLHFVMGTDGKLAVVVGVPPLEDELFSLRVGTPCGNQTAIFEAAGSNVGVPGRHVFVMAPATSEEYFALRPTGDKTSLEKDVKCIDGRDPCDGDCPPGYLCSPREDGLYCVDCAGLVRVQGRTSFTACCTADRERRTCVQNSVGGKDVVCRRDDKSLSGYKRAASFTDFFDVDLDGEGEVDCEDVDTFRVGRRLCKLLEGSEGKLGRRKCYYGS